jgi:hypothetical protein
LFFLLKFFNAVSLFSDSADTYNCLGLLVSVGLASLKVPLNASFPYDFPQTRPNSAS